MNDRHILAIFAKEPKSGSVKSRLAAATSPEWAAQVAEAFLLDWLARLKDFPARRRLAFAPPQAEAYFAKVAEDNFEIEAQCTGDLGMRMQAFLTRRLKVGDEKIVIIGTDSPTLPVGYLHRAFAELEQADVVIGPAKDGGYYLIGCSRRVPDVFTDIDWGQETVLERTVDRLRGSNVRFVLLPSWYDVDTVTDWKVLCDELRKTKPGLCHIERLVVGQEKNHR